MGNAPLHADLIPGMLVPSRCSGASGQAAGNGLIPFRHFKPCYQTGKHKQTCMICGLREKYMHIPLGHVGQFCLQCCPVCTNRGRV